MFASPQRPILIVDAMNLFVRSYAAFPQMSAHGYQMGGCIGFLKTLKRLVTELQPRAVYVAWEGGGSQRRRSLYSEYKLNRKPEKLNRFYEDDIPDTEENRKHQIITLLEMLKCSPVCQVYVSDCEGDDVIAYLCRAKFRGQPKVIASSDKDFYQLLDDTTVIYSFHKKTYVTSSHVFDEYRVQPRNFALAKALCGDASDNIPGVKGVGFKTAAKLFPFLGHDEDVLLRELLDYAQSHRDESAVYRKVAQGENEVLRNWRLVYLDGSMLSATQATVVDRAIDTWKFKSDRVGMIKRLVREGIGDFDVEGYMYAFNCIENVDGLTGSIK